MERLLPRMRDDERLAQLLQGVADGHGGALIVIDDEDLRLGHCLGRRGRLGDGRQLLHRVCDCQFWPATERSVTTLFPAASMMGAVCPIR